MPPTAGRDANAVKLGVGRWYIAPIGTAEPASLTATPNAAFVDLGYTREGSQVALGSDFEDVEVAEELEPIATIQTARTTTVSLELAQDTAYNMAYALNADTATSVTVNATDISVEPPAAGTYRYMMLLWEDGATPAANTRRHLFRKVVNVGSSELAFRKGNEYTGLPLEFSVNKPQGAAAWKRWYHPDLKGAA
jgi:hypothetical protein